MLSNIAESVREMSKDNPSIEIVEEKTKQFLSALEVVALLICTTKYFILQKIDYSLSEEIAYLSEVSTTHPHVGSIYGEEKVLGISLSFLCNVNTIHLQDYELTCQQVILAKERLNKLLNSLSSKSQLSNSHAMSFVSS